MKKFFYAIYIVMLCIQFPQPTMAQGIDDGVRRVQQTVRVVPDSLDGITVYPTGHARVPLNPLRSYEWEYIDIPDEWISDRYIMELWDANNRPIPGYTARSLSTEQDYVHDGLIDISEIDPTLYPMVRLVIFLPIESNESLEYKGAPVWIQYSERANTRLIVFAAVLLAMILGILSAMRRYSISLLSVVRESVTLIQRDHYEEILPAATRFALLAAMWASVFGAVLGIYVGGIQVVYLLIKLPFVLLITFVFSFASSAVLSLLLGIRASVQELLAQSLRVLASFSVALASFSPIMLFYIVADYSHDQLLAAFMAIMGLSSLVAALTLWLWIRSRAPGGLAIALTATWFGVYGVVLMQFGWMLRPWVGQKDPIHGLVSFARLDSSSVFEAIIHTLQRL